MKTVHVKMLLMVLIGMLTNGCTGIYFSQCKTPDVDKPIISNDRCKSTECVYDKVLINYESMKAYAEDLYNANQICK